MSKTRKLRSEAGKKQRAAQQPDSLMATVNRFLRSWKVRLAGIAIALLSIVLTIFFWEFIVAETGMKTWATDAGAKPIDCVLKDTNGNGYVNCTALLQEQVVPLECGSSLWNLGCRVTSEPLYHVNEEEEAPKEKLSSTAVAGIVA